MNIYKISQNVNANWQTYESAVVVAESSDVARNMYPDGGMVWRDGAWVCIDGTWECCKDGRCCTGGTWCTPEDVKVELLGVAVEGSVCGVVCANFR